MAGAEKVAGGIALACFVGGTAVCSYAVCDPVGRKAASKAAVAERKAEAQDLSERRSEIKSGIICNGGARHIVDDAVLRTEGHTVFVAPEAWASMRLEHRTVLATWAGVCNANEDRSVIIDGNTGNTEARWSLGAGYMPE